MNKSPSPSRPSTTPRPADDPTWRYIKAGLIAAAIAFVCFIAVRVTSKKVRDLTPEEVRTQMESGEFKIETAIAQINRMDFNDRRELMQSPQAQSYFQKLSAPDRKRLVIETMDKGIRVQIERFHKMNATERGEFIAEVKQRQLEERERFMKLPKEEQDKRREMMNSSSFEEIVGKAVQAYLSVSTSQERAELAPLYEGALDNVRAIRGQ
ncbi:MAG: hypothetical protein WCT04_16590 [Planctomycetota bacterium]